MAARHSTIHVRVDDDLKARATTVLDDIGLSMSDAVRLLFSRVVGDQAFPWELKVPNAETRAAMLDADDIIRRRRVRLRLGGS